MKRTGPKHKLCRRIGMCVWGNPKCPSAKRPYPPGQHGKSRRSKLSTYGELLLEKQKVRAHYAVSERQLQALYRRARQGGGSTAEKLMRSLELRLATVVFRSGLAPSIFAARQAVNHRHVLVDGRIVDRSAYRVKPGQVVSIDPQRSPALASVAQQSDVAPPEYLEVDRENVRVKVLREPAVDEIPANVEIMRVIEFYAR